MDNYNGYYGPDERDYRCKIGSYLAFGGMNLYIRHIETCKTCQTDLTIIKLKQESYARRQTNKSLDASSS